MKVLFLDVDGVLSKRPYPNCSGSVQYKKIKILKKIVEKTKCKIVLSSFWRTKEKKFKEITKKLSKYDLKIMDKTPIYKNGKRSDEINDWLKDHPSVKKYVIIDDVDQFDDYQKKFFVKINPKKGLVKKDAKEIINILN